VWVFCSSKNFKEETFSTINLKRLFSSHKTHRDARISSTRQKQFSYSDEIRLLDRVFETLICRSFVLKCTLNLFQCLLLVCKTFSCRFELWKLLSLFGGWWWNEKGMKQSSASARPGLWLCRLCEWKERGLLHLPLHAKMHSIIPKKVSFHKFITLNKFFAFLIPNQMHS
jgi:hypothetical protein